MNRTRGSGRAPSQRQRRVGEELRHALARILQQDGLRDQQLAGVSITVTEVRISPDLRNATAFVVPLGGAEGDKVVAALGRAAAYLRGRVAREVQLRNVPQLTFVRDASFDNAARIDALLGQSSAVSPDAGHDDGDGP